MGYICVELEWVKARVNWLWTGSY